MNNPKEVADWAAKIADSVPERYRNSAFTEILKHGLVQSSLTPLQMEDKPETFVESPDRGDESALSKFVQELGLSEALVVGAFGPIHEEPFIHLDPHFWEAFKRAVPAKGPGSISDIAIAATVLALWQRHRLITQISIHDAKNVLRQIGVNYHHPVRGIEACEWLQIRGTETVLINPAEISRAIEMCKAFAEKRVPEKLRGE